MIFPLRRRWLWFNRKGDTVENQPAEVLNFFNDSISRELKVSKPTLIKWSQELEREINNAQYFASQSLIEPYKITKQERIHHLTKELKKIYDVMGQKEYKELSIKDLILIKDKYENALGKEFANISYCTGEFESLNLKTVVESSKGKEITLDLE